ncbi:hypothetical protein GBA52_019888 [Prunus armeniaca]|nr:hypothetical protein GBA52_019888 [Prunus armeniaca]
MNNIAIATFTVSSLPTSDSHYIILLEREWKWYVQSKNTQIRPLHGLPQILLAFSLPSKSQEVTEVGSKVEKFKVGDKVGVGCMVGSCQSCDSCANNFENYCPELILTYGEKYHDGTTTYGGYSDFMVVDEHFIVRIPDNLPLDGAAPLLCAGITTYSPLRYFELDKPGMHVGVVGLGGVGHLAVKFAKAMGVKVTVISTSPNKEKEAIEHLHADSFIVSHDQDQMQVIV